MVQREREPVVAARYGDAPPPPSAYNFDPRTGAPVRRNVAFGATTQLPDDPLVPDMLQQSLAAPAPTSRPRRAGRWLALSLIAFGSLILADQLGFNMDVVFPVVMIAIGVFLLRKR